VRERRRPAGEPRSRAGAGDDAPARHRRQPDPTRPPLLTESLLIAAAGAAGGLAVGRLGIVLLNQIQYPTEMVAPPVLHLEQRALWFSLAVAMASAVLVGLGPALQTTRVDLTTSLKSDDRGGTTRRGVSADRPSWRFRWRCRWCC
jgi:hypothetical protein